MSKEQMSKDTVRVIVNDNAHRRKSRHLFGDGSFPILPIFKVRKKKEIKSLTKLWKRVDNPKSRITSSDSNDSLFITMSHDNYTNLWTSGCWGFYTLILHLQIRILCTGRLIGIENIFICLVVKK